MAAFSYQPNYPFHLDSVFSQNTNCFSQFYSPHPLIESHEGKKQSTESSAAVDKLENGEQVLQKVITMEKKRKKYTTGSSAFIPANSKDGREGGSKKQKKCFNGEIKEEDNKKPKTEKKVDEETTPGYIHVRARRGQATDSHSLAERVRREKISERMKILQRLVPGCDKVSGKAFMLDEIINYVQSLQNQVELLSMKLASVNPLFFGFGMDLNELEIRTEGLMSDMASSLPPVQQQCIQFADSTTITTAAATTLTAATDTFASPNDYCLIDNSASFLVQEQRPCDFIEDSSSLLWDIEEHRQKFLNPSGISNNLCSFH